MVPTAVGGLGHALPYLIPVFWTATILAIFYIPLFFVLVRRGVRDGLASIRERMHRRRTAEA